MNKDELLQQAIAALKLCKAELQGWTVIYGHDLDTAEAILAADTVIKKSKGGD